MTPSTYYYLGLYVLVLVIRYFKLKKDPTGGPPWPRVLFVSLEIVYTSAGFIILLLENLRELIAPIVVFYIILIFVSSNLDSMDDRFSPRQKIFFHLGILILIVGSTVYSFQTVLKPKPVLTEAAQQTSLHSFRVGIPYSDESLSRHVGVKVFGTRKLAFVTVVTAPGIERARELAIQRFWSDGSVVPFKAASKTDRRSLLNVDTDNVTVQRL